MFVAGHVRRLDAAMPDGDPEQGREFKHRLMDFNNLPETTLEDIHRVLDVARARVAARLAADAQICGM